jgi:hypothetical protein
MPRRDIVLIASPPFTFASPPVGIGYLAENLRRHGYQAPIAQALIDGSCTGAATRS